MRLCAVSLNENSYPVGIFLGSLQCFMKLSDTSIRLQRMALTALFPHPCLCWRGLPLPARFLQSISPTCRGYLSGARVREFPAFRRPLTSSEHLSFRVQFRIALSLLQTFRIPKFMMDSSSEIL